MRKSVFVFIALMAHPASTQVNSGTVVIINFAKDQIVVAADSLTNNPETGPDYSYCKIATFDHQLIFTSVGHLSMAKLAKPLWNNTDLAREAVRAVRRPNNRAVKLDSVVEHWAKALKNRWSGIDRDWVSATANATHGQLTSGIFVGKGLIVKVAVIYFDPANLPDPVQYMIVDGSSSPTCLPCGQLNGEQVCVAGHYPDVGVKFCSARKYGDRIDIRTPLRKASISTELAVKIAEVTIDTYGQTVKDVGGKVDAVTITNDGSITWNARKKNCPDNQD